MNIELTAAVESLAAICKKQSHNILTNSEHYLQEVEKYYGFTLPTLWRDILVALKKPPHRVPWRSGKLDMDPMNAAEHQVETDDGMTLTKEGFIVIGYMDGLGDCIIMKKEDVVDDPEVFYHHHDNTENDSLGSMSNFFGHLREIMDAEGFGVKSADHALSEIDRRFLEFSEYSGRAKEVEDLLKQGANIDARDKGARTALMLGMRQGVQDIDELLINHGADVNAKDRRGKSVFQYSLEGGVHERTHRILRAGASFSADTISGKQYASLVSSYRHAVRIGDIDLVASYLNGGLPADAVQEGDDRTALYTLCGKNKIEIMELLLKHGADPHIMSASMEETPLARAKRKGTNDEVALLLEHCNSN